MRFIIIFIGTKFTMISYQVERDTRNRFGLKEMAQITQQPARAQGQPGTWFWWSLRPSTNDRKVRLLGRLNYATRNAPDTALAARSALQVAAQ